MGERIEPSNYLPEHVRVKDGWITVLADPRKTKTESGILLAPNETGVEKVTEGMGVIVRVGPGERNVKIGLEKGMRIFYRGFLKHANPIESEERWGKPYEDQKKMYFIMNSDDVLGILAPGVEVGVFSGRPMVPEAK